MRGLCVVFVAFIGLSMASNSTSFSEEDDCGAGLKACYTFSGFTADGTPSAVLSVEEEGLYNLIIEGADSNLGKIFVYKAGEAEPVSESLTGVVSNVCDGDESFFVGDWSFQPYGPGGSNVSYTFTVSLEKAELEANGEASTDRVIQANEERFYALKVDAPDADVVRSASVTVKEGTINGLYVRVKTTDNYGAAVPGGCPVQECVQDKDRLDEEGGCGHDARMLEKELEGGTKFFINSYYSPSGTYYFMVVGGDASATYTIEASEEVAVSNPAGRVLPSVLALVAVLAMLL